MSRTQQDQFIDDDEEETCPLCVEEFDLSDRGFRPCPCQYQVCQFCYHNVRTNMNGLCPACRRPYDDKNIEFRKPSAEEEAAWRAKLIARQKRTTTAQQKEAQKREADTANRKHLAGLRVVQKNLVYVTGLSPSVQEDRLLETLRGQQYFGQYGKIVKIVVSKAKDNQSSVGVYVTYARKEDAALCINAVDGSPNGDRVLRAQFGTTKYCSAYLRNEQCQNRSCMFLHEPGEDKDSFTRQDLSSMNIASSQSQSAFMPSQAPPQSQQPVAAAARPETTASAPTSAEPGPALPSTASWASKPQPPSRSVSRAATGASASPALTTATPAVVSVGQSSQSTSASASAPIAPSPTDSKSEHKQQEQPQPQLPPTPVEQFAQYVHSILSQPPLEYKCDLSSFSEEERAAIRNTPSLFDPDGGHKRRMRKLMIMEEQRRLAEEGSSRDGGDDVIQRSGSLQLGGEPDNDGSSGQQPGGQNISQQGAFDSGFALDNDLGQLNLNARGVTQAQQQLLLQRLKSSPSQGPGFSTPPQQQSGVFTHQMSQGSQPGHARNVSRFSFANDTSATTSVKPVANSKLMNQQSSMMPPQAGGGFGQQSSFFTSTVSGPPPGLRTTGTPPVSGGGMFGQGHGFATAGLTYGSNMTSRNSNDEMMRDIYRRREQGTQEAGKRSSPSPAIHQHSPHAEVPAPHQGFLQKDQPSQGRATPPVPPGLEGLGQALRSHNQHLSDSGLKALKSREHSQTDSKLAKSSASAPQPSSASKDVPLATVASDKQNKSSNSKSWPKPDVSGALVPEKDGHGFKAKTATSLVTSSNKDAASEKTVHTAQQDRPGKQPDSKADARSPVAATPMDRGPSTPAKKKSTNETTILAAQSSPVLSPAEPVATHGPSNKSASQVDTKKPHLGRIDLASAVGHNLERSGTPKSATSDTPSRSQIPGTPALSSRAASPSPMNDAGAKRRAHTIRIVSNTAPESQPLSALSSQVHKMPSRNPSITSAIMPGTPSSEQISDTISMASNTVSRPASPPLGSIVGSATVRAKTKNQLKKERQERAKVLEEGKKVSQDLEVEVKSEPVQEAITSRQKKAKKPSSAPKPKAAKIEALAQVASPVEESTTEDPTVDASPDPIKLPEEPTMRSVPGAWPAQNSTTDAGRTTPVKLEAETVSPAQIVGDLRSTSNFVASCLDTFFRPLAAQQAAHKPSQPINPATDLDLERRVQRNPDINLPPNELADVLRLSRPLQYGGGTAGGHWTHGCITPGGAHLRHLETELEERYLLLERELKAIPEHLRYHPRIMSNAIKNALPLFDLEAMRQNLEGGGARARQANAMEKAVEEGSKKGSFLVGDAEGYVDEFVMPVTPGPVFGHNGSSSSHAPLAPSNTSTSPSNSGAGAKITKFVEELTDDDLFWEKTGRPMSVQEIEKLLAEVKRQAEEAEKELRKAIKKNRKLAGYAH